MKLENPLAGIPIPGIDDIVEQIMAHVGEGILDLRQPMQRQRLRGWLRVIVAKTIQIDTQRAIQAATTKAVEHVFRAMHDADYQEKKRLARQSSRKRAKERREEKEAAERDARMECSRKALQVEKTTIQ